MSVTANVVVVQGVRTKSSWFVSDEGGPDSLGKKLAEYLLDGNSPADSEADSFADRFASENKMRPVNGRKSAVWVYIVDFENRSVELDGVVYGYQDFYARCCLDSVYLPYFDADCNSLDYTDTPRTTLYNFDLKSGRPSLCGAGERDPPMHRSSVEFYARFSLEKEEPVLKI